MCLTALTEYLRDSTRTIYSGNNLNVLEEVNFFDSMLAEL